jgi:transcriptional regulator with XRE-family HTH domain
MNTMDKRREKLIARLKDKEHRDAFVSAHIQVGIPFQIRALREQRPWTQQELADRAGVKQSWIATLESPNYSGFSLKTLLKFASAFDIGLIVRFVPISELVEHELRLSPESLTPVSFDEDPYFNPSVTHIVGSGEMVLGGEGIVSVYYPEIKAKSDLFYLNDARQKIPENEMDAYQKEMDMPLHNSLAGGIRQ